ncbi:MAG: TAXI family TRAP transporter solute-binding subunit [Candidatus Poribacteria bacterium]|nr:TAXI family TRAP transporter solute-binding subunit [Candidatus Poribacteria bacterium]
MKSILFYLSIICVIFAVGCDNASKRDTAQGEKSDTTAKLVNDSTSKRRFVSVGTAPAGGAFFVVGSAIAEVVAGNAPEAGWEVTAEATKGTQENIRRIVSGELEFALANAAISYFAVRGEGAWETEYTIRTVMTLAPNVGLFITSQSSGIRTIQDFDGKRIVVGPAGAGFEYFLKPILAAHGVTYEDFTPINSHYIGAVDLLADGSAAAAFMGGAIPTPAVTQASTSQNIFFIPLDETAKQSLFEDYPFFNAITIPANTYKGQTEPFASMNVGAMHLITAENVDENMVYEFTKTLYTHRAEVVKRHGAGKAINPKNVVKDTGTPFHPGAIRFYREIGIWNE